jgi:predicted amidohydrolase YtcJ
MNRYARYYDLISSGKSVSLSADVPSSTLDLVAPLFSAECAMTLQDPHNPDSKKFPPNGKGASLENAIKAITIFPAWQLHMEDKIGTLEVGKYADIVVLEKNLFDVGPRDVAHVKVLAAMMDGRFTHRSGL